MSADDRCQQTTVCRANFQLIRSSGDHAFKQLLEDLAARTPLFHLHVIYSQAGADDQAGREFQHVGRVKPELLRGTLPHGLYS
jgi:ferredoxin-NADP reductase